MDTALLRGTQHLIDSALLYVEYGMPVFPLWSVIAKADGSGFTCRCAKYACGDQGKHPIGKIAPRGCHSAVTDRTAVEHMFTNWPESNVGIATGSVIVVDIDPRNGGDVSLRELEQQHGPMPATWRSATGGGGEHIIFAAPAGKKISGRLLATGIDLKGVGGYIVAPPSLHVSGRRYEWLTAPGDVPLAALPDWIAKPASNPFTAHSGSTSKTCWGPMISSDVGEGARNKTLAKIAGYLLRRYVDIDVSCEMLSLWNAAHCKPPLNDDELNKIIGSICKAEMRRRANG
jgi:Bifunctional DNA primase/polymerase, N-terminal/Primase C terminal 1 (PriCT-1)